MAKSALERKRESLARKAKERESQPDLTQPYQKGSFDEFYRANSVDVDIPLNIAGLPGFDFSDDQRDPRSFDGEIEKLDAESGDEGATYRGYSGSIGRAEIMVNSLLDAATALAEIINRFKVQEIERAIRDLEQSDLSDPEARKRALAEIVRLNKIRDRLGKQVRRSLPEWKVKGD